MEILFQDCAKRCHHIISARACAFRCTWWSRALTVIEASIRLLTNVSPGLMTFMA